MKLLSSDKIREADAYTIANEPIASVDLMERAAIQLQQWIMARYVPKQRIKLLLGPGNNGGDGWALARLLWKEGYQDIEIYLLGAVSNLSADSETNRQRLEKECEVTVHPMENDQDFPCIGTRDLVIDALFGSGLSRPLEGLAAQLVERVNSTTAQVIAVDIPSGLMSEQNTPGKAIVKADYTLCFQVPKLAFFFAENDSYVGDWHVLPIGLHADFLDGVETSYFYTLEKDVRGQLRPREKFAHKGNFGHGLLIAGSRGMMGAAVLAAQAAVRSGVGLLTTHVPRLGSDVIQTSIPESLLSIDESDLIFTEHPNLQHYTAIAIGPGLNQKANTTKGLATLLQEVECPLVLDADALNLLAKIDNWREMLPQSCILTPHPKEFERLFGKFNDSYSRLQHQLEFSEKHNCAIVLKGANTCITTPEGYAFFNSTGNPGMARGGSGDVLTGLILGLLAQRYSPSEAAIMGVYIHGLAGDLAAKEYGQYGLTPTDLIKYIGKAFCILEK